MWDRLSVFYEGKTRDEVERIKTKLSLTPEMESAWTRSSLINVEKKLQSNKKQQTRLNHRKEELDILWIFSYITNEEAETNRPLIKEELERIKGKLSKLGKEKYKLAKDAIEGRLS
ncbi:MAG: hypothetical protein ACOC44_18560 [Promethearchaeia archaeon]